MALVLSYNKTIHGKLLTFNDSYIKVSSVLSSNELAHARVIIYVDSQKLDALEEKNYTFVPNMGINSENCIKQAYDHIKELPEYTGAMDV